MERRGDGVPIIQRETRSLSGMPARFELIGGSELCVILPAAPQELAPTRSAIAISHGGQPVAGASLVVFFPNKTSQHTTTDASGQAAIALHTPHLPMTVFAAAEGFAARVEHTWIPAHGDLSLELDPLPGGGSIIFKKGAGRIPGLLGEMRPGRDAYDRTYLFTSNMTIDQGRRQPVYFLLGEELRLTDTFGGEMVVRILDVADRTALVEYRPVDGTAGRT